MAPSVVAVVRIRAVGNQQLDALKAAGANRGAERDVTVGIRRVDDTGVRSGNLGVMDYMRYRNIESDTSMRQSISEGEEGGSEPLG